MNKEKLNLNFNINAKYEDMIETATIIVEDHLKHNHNEEAPLEISLAYDVKNYLPQALNEIQKLKEERKELYRYTPENGFRRVEDEDE